MVGGRSREPRPQYCRPGEPAIANHQTHHEVNKELSRRLGASGARNRSPRRKRGIPAKMPVHWTASPERETNKTQPHQPAPGTNEPEAPAPNQTSDSHQQAQPSTTGEFREWPDIPPTWELERDARGHLETDPNYPSNSVLGTIARQLLGWSPSARGWLEPLCGEKVTPSECSAPAPKVVGLTLSQLDMNAAASQKMYRTVQERRLTSLHSFRDANPFTLS